MSRLAFEALGIELTEDQPATRQTKQTKRNPETMKKVFAAAGIGAAIAIGSLVGAGTANADTNSFLQTAAQEGWYLGPNTDAKLLNNGQMVCQMMASDQNWVQLAAVRVRQNTGMSQTDSNNFVSLAAIKLCSNLE